MPFHQETTIKKEPYTKPLLVSCMAHIDIAIKKTDILCPLFQKYFEIL